MVEKGSIAGLGLLSAFILEILGIPIQPLVWGLIGGALGMPFVKKQGLAGAAFAYIAGSMVSALIGHSIADAMHWQQKMGNLMAAGMGIFFHVILARLVTRIPFLTDKAVDYAGGLIPKGSDKP